MICIKCGKNNDKVLDSRPTEDGYSIRRRRECIECGYRFSTVERIEDLYPTVIKKNGTREPFMAEKIMASLNIACSKRGVSPQDKEKIVAEISDKVNNTYNREITSSEIGEFIMNRLRNMDKVAYVRFASVYKDFTDPQSFADEVSRISDENQASSERNK